MKIKLIKLPETVQILKDQKANLSKYLQRRLADAGLGKSEKRK
jgi:hypothetical protein